VLALAELINHKQMLPSFSLRLVAPRAPRRKRAAEKSEPAKKNAGEILTTPVYFPYLPRQQRARQGVELLFPIVGFTVRTRSACKRDSPLASWKKRARWNPAWKLLSIPP